MQEQDRAKNLLMCFKDADGLDRVRINYLNPAMLRISVLDNSQNILLILDDENVQLPEVVRTYTDTWGKNVKTIILKEYDNNEESIYMLWPDFEDIEDVDVVSIGNDERDEPQIYTEDYHLSNASPEIRQLYLKIKELMSLKMPDVHLNHQRYYVSLRKKRNFAFIKIRKSKIKKVVMEKEEAVRNKVLLHEVKPLSEGVQNFYGGPCCQIIINKDQNLDELIKLLLEIQK